MTMLLILPGLGGCDQSADARSSDGRITVTYWTRSWWGDPQQYQGPDPVSVPQWQREQIAEFERRHPHIRVNLKTDPGSPDKLRLAFAGGVPPDVFHTNPEAEFLNWADLGFLEPIDPYLTEAERTDIFPAALAAGEYRGNHYAWPLYSHALCMAINRDLFRERGLEDRIPGAYSDWTWAEFEDLARQLTFDRDGDGRIDVYGVGLGCLDDNHVFLTSYLVNFGARVFARDGRFVLNSDAGVRGLEFLRRLVDEKIATPGVSAYKYEDVRALFLEQKIGMYLVNAGIVDWAEDQARKGTIKPFDWALAPIPHEPGVRQSSYLAVGAVLVSAQRDQEKRRACMELARFITSHEVNRVFWNRASPRRSSPLPPDPNMAVMMRQVERAENFMLPPARLPDRFNLTRVMVQLYQDAFSHPPRYTPEQALDHAAERVNRAVARAKDGS